MVELGYLRSHKEIVLERLKKRNLTDEDLQIVDQILSIDDQRRQSQTAQDNLLHKEKQLSSQIGNLYKSGQREEADKMKTEVAEVKEQRKQLQEQKETAEKDLQALLLSLPNIPHESVPAGNSDEDNEVFKAWTGDLPDLGDNAQAHWDLAEKYNIIDFGLGVKITGSGFPLFRAQGARLQRALINFFLDEAHKAGYEEIVPPLLVNEDTARATGQLPDKEGQMYYMEKDDFYLIPTAEVPITNIHRGDLLTPDQLPIKLTGYTPCFRREAGAHGKDTRGLNRVHQFDKIEIVQMVHPDKSYDVLMEMLSHVEGLLQQLELPYRILRLCGGDLGQASALTYDFEVYSAGQKRWLEVSSVSNFETYQSNRMKLRFRPKDGKPQLVHTLNGSALALARIVAALLENNQTADGIVIPKVLQPYTGFERIS